MKDENEKEAYIMFFTMTESFSPPFTYHVQWYCGYAVVPHHLLPTHPNVRNANWTLIYRRHRNYNMTQDVWSGGLEGFWGLIQMGDMETYRSGWQ